jgi:hypothetical protein
MPKAVTTAAISPFTGPPLPWPASTRSSSVPADHTPWTRPGSAPAAGRSRGEPADCAGTIWCAAVRPGRVARPGNGRLAWVAEE